MPVGSKKVRKGMRASIVPAGSCACKLVSRPERGPARPLGIALDVDEVYREPPLT
jgi:hypothetical protein